MTCPTCDTLRAELQRAREALHETAMELRKGMQAVTLNYPLTQASGDAIRTLGRLEEKVRAALSSTPPQGPRHATNEEGDCASWCRACADNEAKGLNPAGTPPQGPCPHGVTKTETEHCCACEGCLEAEGRHTAPTYTAEQVELALSESWVESAQGPGYDLDVEAFRAALGLSGTPPAPTCEVCGRSKGHT